MSSVERVLDLDLGNSVMKYRCGEVRGRLDYLHVGDAPERVPEVAGPEFVLPDLSAVTRVRVSSVLGAEHNAALVGAVQRQWGIDCEFARSSARCAGVKNGYADPASLGVDRWLAMLAAYHRTNGPVLVVDLGTAVTLDYVTAGGQHLGGYIVPGVQLMRHSLLNETAAIRFEVVEPISDLSPGRQTRDAVERGALVTLVQLISAELERFDKLCDHNSRLVLCGGDAERVRAHLQCDHSVVADLVLDGLALALPGD